MQEFTHRPVLVAEVLAALQLGPAGRYADGTLGGGGHAAAILAASSPAGWLSGCDRDGAAVDAARGRLSEFIGRFEIRQGNFAELADWVPARSCDGVLLDLGVSSAQLDVPERGFSFQQDGPLDMRMDTSQRRTAAELVNKASGEELAGMFWDFGGEPEARRIAREIVRQRQQQPFRTTRQLSHLIERLKLRHGHRTHPATKAFQALRLAVNDELGSLQRGLVAASTILKSGGRLVVITFHSVEDRLVKEFGNERSRGYTFDGTVDVPELRKPHAPELRWVTRKAIRPSEAEIAENPRSRSAQLRVMQKI